jgi:hypothetical protein
MSELDYGEAIVLSLAITTSICCAGFLILQAVLSTGVVFVEDFGTGYLFGYYLLLCLYIILLGALQTRAAVFESQHLQTNLEMKRACVRYFSYYSYFTILSMI